MPVEFLGVAATDDGSETGARTGPGAVAEWPSTRARRPDDVDGGTLGEGLRAGATDVNVSLVGTEDERRRTLAVLGHLAGGT